MGYHLLFDAVLMLVYLEDRINQHQTLLPELEISCCLTSARNELIRRHF
jgi:hypothetical protein